MSTQTQESPPIGQRERGQRVAGMIQRQAGNNPGLNFNMTGPEKCDLAAYIDLLEQVAVKKSGANP